ncbi:TIGR02679 domain-containing protein [Catellatospora methionotrophica]|uniref:TIGR02679 domain-containing protein n=1 Tax=Catellatospora methionotrophica TaxID=121620 RepID=UPI0033F4C538
MTTPRSRGIHQGRRAERLAELAIRTGLFRALYDIDRTNATNELGRFRGLQLRPEAVAVTAAWRADQIATEAGIIETLRQQLPEHAAVWVIEDAVQAIKRHSELPDERRRLADQLHSTATHLPANGIARADLAQRAVGSTHGLDSNRPLGRLATRMAAAIAQLPKPANASDERQCWDAVGVWLDPVSSNTAGWNLPIHPHHPAHPINSGYTQAGQPALLTAGLLAMPGELIRMPTCGEHTLWVVEGLGVLAALAQQRPRASILCRAGMPSTATRTIIRAAVRAGWTIAVSSDFEPGGLRGAINVLACAGSAGRPWRLDVLTYLTGASDGDPFPPTQVPRTPWEPPLADALRIRGQRVSEESRISDLLLDLRG